MRPEPMPFLVYTIVQSQQGGAWQHHSLRHEDRGGGWLCAMWKSPSGKMLVRLNSKNAAQPNSEFVRLRDKVPRTPTLLFEEKMVLF